MARTFDSLDYSFNMSGIVNNQWMHWIALFLIFLHGFGYLEQFFHRNYSERYCILQGTMAVTMYNKEDLCQIRHNSVKPPLNLTTVNRMKSLRIKRRRRGQKGGCRCQRSITALSGNSAVRVNNNNSINQNNLVHVP